MDKIDEGMAELRGEDARHLARVLRAEPGRQYEISDNASAYLAEVVESHSGRVLFRVIEKIAGEPLPVCIDLYAALIKFDRFEWMVEKATELGVARIVPVEAARTEKGLLEASRKRSERWIKIAREAGQQSRRVQAPEILPAVRFSGGLAADAACRLFLEESEAPPLLRILDETCGAAGRLALLLGPEGGWTDGERAAAARAGWRPVSLSPLVLRAETAAAAALAVLMNARMR